MSESTTSPVAITGAELEAAIKRIVWQAEAWRNKAKYFREAANKAKSQIAYTDSAQARTNLEKDASDYLADAGRFDTSALAAELVIEAALCTLNALGGVPAKLEPHDDKAMLDAVAVAKVLHIQPGKSFVYAGQLPEITTAGIKAAQQHAADKGLDSVDVTISGVDVTIWAKAQFAQFTLNATEGQRPTLPPVAAKAKSLGPDAPRPGIPQSGPN